MTYLNFVKIKHCMAHTINSYKERLLLLRNIFEESETMLNLKIIDARCNVILIISQLLKNAP